MNPKETLHRITELANKNQAKEELTQPSEEEQFVRETVAIMLGIKKAVNRHSHTIQGEFQDDTFFDKVVIISQGQVVRVIDYQDEDSTQLIPVDPDAHAYRVIAQDGSLGPRSKLTPINTPGTNWFDIAVYDLSGSAKRTEEIAPFKFKKQGFPHKGPLNIPRIGAIYFGYYDQNDVLEKDVLNFHFTVDDNPEALFSEPFHQEITLRHLPEVGYRGKKFKPGFYPTGEYNRYSDEERKNQRVVFSKKLRELAPLFYIAAGEPIDPNLQLGNQRRLLS